MRKSRNDYRIQNERKEMQQSKELEKDIRELQDKIGAALDYCLELYKRHGDQPGWEMVEDKLTVAIGWAESPLDPVPEEEEDLSIG